MNRDNSIDSLKGIACIIVTFVHLWSSCIEKYNFHEYEYAFFGMGKFGVCIFFILSAYFAYFKDNFSPAIFFIKRFLRVYIPFSVAAVCGWCVGWLATKDSLIGVLDLTSVKGHFWTVAVEVKFYFVFMLLLALNKILTKKRWIIGILCTLSVFCIAIFPPNNWPPNACGIQWYIPVFSLGIIIAIVQRELSKNERTFKDSKVFSVACDCGFIIISIFLLVKVPIIREILFSIPMDDSLINKYLQFGAVAGALVFCVLNGNIIRKVLCKTKILSYVGRHSFTIYLVHYIIFWKLKLYDMGLMAYIILCLALTFVITLIFYEYVEKRLTNYLIGLIMRNENKQ